MLRYRVHLGRSTGTYYLLSAFVPSVALTLLSFTVFFLSFQVGKHTAGHSARMLHCTRNRPSEPSSTCIRLCAACVLRVCCRWASASASA